MVQSLSILLVGAVTFGAASTLAAPVVIGKSDAPHVIHPWQSSLPIHRPLPIGVLPHMPIIPQFRKNIPIQLPVNARELEWDELEARELEERQFAELFEGLIGAATKGVAKIAGNAGSKAGSRAFGKMIKGEAKAGLEQNKNQGQSQPGKPGGRVVAMIPGFMTRDFAEDELNARESDEIMERDFAEDELNARESDEIMEREYDGDDAVYAREYLFDELD